MFSDLDKKRYRNRLGAFFKEHSFHYIDDVNIVYRAYRTRHGEY